MPIDFAIDETAGITPSPWQPMSTAPQSILRPILLRAKWAGRPVAIVGVYMREHGAFRTCQIARGTGPGQNSVDRSRADVSTSLSHIFSFPKSSPIFLNPEARK